jgi:hypothetical protein
MLNYFIKNETPYLGKLKLKLEKYPHYSGGDSGKLNKIHLNLGFTKLVSRMIPRKTLTGWEIDPVAIELINKYTDGKITDHEWDHGSLVNSFMTSGGSQYIGDINEGWWYFKNGMTVCPEYPRGVALKWRTAVNDKTLVSGHNGLLGYYGYTHRGGCLFSKGDRLFDESYKPIAQDYEQEEWQKWQAQYEKLLSEGDDFDRKWLEEDGISSVIPFNKRGLYEIVNWEQARLAAHNLSKYLS